MGTSMRRAALKLEHVLRRDHYLDDLNQRIDDFKDIQSARSRRVIDGAAGVDAGAGPNPVFDVPEVAAAKLDVDFLKQSMRDSGCCLVRGFFGASDVERMRAFVDYSFDRGSGDSALQAYLSKQVSLDDVLEKTREDIERHRLENDTYTDTLKIGRKLTRTLGADVSVLTATSPILAAKLLRLFDRNGIRALLAEYFEHEPCVSVYKWVLRRAVSPKQPIDFHQDGAFMGDEIDSMNCWVPLTDCGAGSDAPGMDIVPARFMRAFAKGSGVMNWTVSPQAVIDAFGEDAVVTPSFRAGDAFFFDHCLIHRTQYMPEAARRRYALETWFFDSVNFPKNQIPLRW